jgi:hypothetical protein
MEKFNKDDDRFSESKISIFKSIESKKVYITKGYRHFRNPEYSRFVEITLTNLKKLLLDTYSNAAAAYSLRSLSSSYSGPLIRVRRSSDNQEQDIYAVNGQLNTDYLTSFVGSQNLIPDSESSANISVASMTKSENNILAPDNTNTGDTLFETAVFGTHIGFHDYTTAVIGQSYTYSVYIKSVGGRGIDVKGSTGFSGVSAAISPTGTIINSTGTVAVEAASNGWFRVSLTNVASGTSLRMIIYSLDGTTTSFNGDITKGVGIWGRQLSAGTTVLPYNKTISGIGGNGFVTTWYDQSGNSRNATQSTAASQPQIVSAGNVILKNGKAEIDFTSDFLTIPSSSGTFKYLHDGTNSSIFSVATFGKVADPNEIYCLIGNNGNTSSKTGILIAYDDRTSVVRNNSNFIYVTMGSGGIISDVANNAITPNAQRLLSYFLDADNSTASLRSQTGINGSALVGNNNTSAAPVVTNASHDLQIGASGNNLTLLTGGIQELIFYDYSQSPNRSIIETSINQYYSIY